jgi:hypothetical protein
VLVNEFSRFDKEIVGIKYHMMSTKWYKLEVFNSLGWLGQESHQILATHGRLLLDRGSGVDQSDQIPTVVFIRRERFFAGFA